ncbi:hypothetical protein HYX58_04250 [Candidatus Dependentiae bacterium]|nr:hypothetical protein [Candidatus Dependentiae bacterium]
MNYIAHLFLFIFMFSMNAYSSHHETYIPLRKMKQHMFEANHRMHGMYGYYPMERDISGTDWQPESIPLDGLQFEAHKWLFMTHDFLNAAYTHQTGPRGGSQLFSTSMFMATAQRDFGNRYTFALRAMFSLDPLMGPKGYRLLLQTGEPGNGETPLIDRQHPHDLFDELAIVNTFEINQKHSVFFYFGLPGQPALGPPIYLMRYSGTYNPEAPISHHWLDSTHVQFGVFTAGYIWQNLKIDTSIFTGREPDQHRYDIERPRFDSYSVRATYNATPNISSQISTGFLKSPEQLEPTINITRTTASLSYNIVWRSIKWQWTGCWGRNQKHPGSASNAFLRETTLNGAEKHIIFGRYEHVEKDDLFPQPFAQEKFQVGKLTIGYIYQITDW